MAIEEYKSNSHKTRERKKEPVAEKKVEKIISGSAKSKKKSGIQKITNVMLNYEVLANIYRQRKNHKLDEWREFCKWIESLPYSELITGEKKSFSALLPMLEPGYTYAQNECVNPDVSQFSKDTLLKKAIFGNPMRQGGKYDE